jgi:hypothetical protein
MSSLTVKAMKLKMRMAGYVARTAEIRTLRSVNIKEETCLEAYNNIRLLKAHLGHSEEKA